MVNTKICSNVDCRRAKQELSLSDFYKQLSGKFGYRSDCKECALLYRRLMASGAEAKKRKKILNKVRQKRPDVMYKRYQIDAKRRNILFQIEKEFAISLYLSSCCYCGASPCPVNGIDRVDNNKGYVVDNCVSCCNRCNEVKSNYSLEETMEHVKKMIQHQLK